MNNSIYLKFGAVLAATMVLSGCSYTFETYSYMKDGELYFDVKQGQSSYVPLFGAGENCVDNISVGYSIPDPTKAAPGGTETKPDYKYHSMWSHKVEQGECSIKLPIKYGSVSGKPDAKAKPMKKGVTYIVSMESPGGGTGGHAFRLEAGTHVVNIPY